MRRFLVIGCGGSGGSTLAYLMDQLRSDLAAHGVTDLPRGWQFVHIDVPTGQDAGPDGIGNTVQQGGRHRVGEYLGVGQSDGSYATVDAAVTRTVLGRDDLGQLASWAPRDPGRTGVSIANGAGQYRALGRMVTLNHATRIRSALAGRWEALQGAEVAGDMAELSAKVPGVGSYDPQKSPLVLIVSSLAGGAGASMLLDVCRILTQVHGIDPGTVGVFAVAPDVFRTVPPADVPGVRPNALASFGEVVAAQTGAARASDQEILRALGADTGRDTVRPFARFFPVGSYIGMDRTSLGDGTPKTVYRSLGRGLAALMVSESATQPFVDYDLTNTGGLTAEQRELGWGESWDPLPWGSFGYGALSMGRDRYSEYAAQRLARTAADRLMDGHLRPDEAAGGEEQLTALLTSQWAAECARFGFPAPGHGGTEAMQNWLLDQGRLGQVALEAAQNAVATQLRPHVEGGDGMAAEDWRAGIRGQLSLRRDTLAAAAHDAAYRWAFGWKRDLEARTLAAVADATARFGLPYARQLVESLGAELQRSVIPGLRDGLAARATDTTALSPQAEAHLANLKGTVQGVHQSVSMVVDAVRGSTQWAVLETSARYAVRLLEEYVADFLAPTERALSEAYRRVDGARRDQARTQDLARVATDLYGSWPSDGDQMVDPRFSAAVTEVLLTDPATFPAMYEQDVRTADEQARDLPFTAARDRFVPQIIAGTWTVTGGDQPEGNLVQIAVPWRPEALAVDPDTRESLIPSRAQLVVHTDPAELLSRARQFVARPDESFDRTSRVSLAEFVAQDPAHAKLLAAQFDRVLTMARPLNSVDPETAQAVHGADPGFQGVRYRYKFSDVPFQNTVAAAAFRSVLADNPRIDPASESNFAGALGTDDRLTRIDVFGSYPNLSPLAFDSIFAPVAEQWRGSRGESARTLFWKWRRSRPLAAALPMGDTERRAMVAGWFVGQITGTLRVPGRGDDAQSASVWDAVNSRWVNFPDPLLTPPSEFRYVNDWLPAVLESVLVAMMRSQEQPVLSSMQPYVLLRGLFDDGENRASEGVTQVRSGERVLAGWLRTGEVPAGGSSRVDASGATSPAERADLVRAWLATIRDHVGTQFLASNADGAAGGGAYARITDRALAGATPIFRDVAPDVWWALRMLDSMLDEAVARAQQGGSAGPAAGPVLDGPVF